MLDVEIAFLESHKDELLKQYGGRVLVISGEQVTGAFDTMEEALQAAVAQHGLKSVLIRRPTEAGILFTAPAFTLGILNANSTQPDNSSRPSSGR